MSVIQGTGTSMYLVAHMKEQAKSMSIDPRKEDEKDPLIQSARTVVVSLSHNAKQAILKDAMGAGSLPRASTFKPETE
ncbi:hypothetical protein OAL97_02375 [Paracoccaceae bacterium]|jgi:hypothetical protein|nr:hypothetical protein [Paracoccaceae bacterium]